MTIESCAAWCKGRNAGVMVTTLHRDQVEGVSGMLRNRGTNDQQEKELQPTETSASTATELSDNQGTINFSVSNSSENMTDLSAASLTSFTDLHPPTEADSSLDLCGVLKSMLVGEPGGLALNRILAFLRGHTSWKSLGATDVLDICMIYDELFLFRVFHGEIVLFLKEPSPPSLSAEPPTVHIERRSLSLFEPVSLPQLSPGDYIPVTVTHVTTPHEIVLNMRTAETSGALSSLVSAMTDFYSNPHSRTALGRYASIGSACAFSNTLASRGGQSWRRGVVTDALEGDLVEVFDVDSGRKTPVPCKELYVLLPRFYELPCQAINARLAMVHPLNGTGWESSVSDRLAQLTLDKVLLCTVVGSKGGILYVLLCDTNAVEDVWLHVMLVEEGLALCYCDDYDVQP